MLYVSLYQVYFMILSILYYIMINPVMFKEFTQGKPRPRLRGANDMK